MTTKTGAADGANTDMTTSVELIELPASIADFALAAGCAHDASKSDVLAAMSRTKADLDKLLAEHGAKSADEALGKHLATKESVDALLGAIGVESIDAAVKKIEVDRKDREIKDARALIEQAIADGKCPANGDKAFAIYETHGMAVLRAHLDALPAQAALSSIAPAQLPPKAKRDPKDEAVLSADDEKMIAQFGLDRDAFIAERKAEMARKADVDDAAE